MRKFQTSTQQPTSGIPTAIAGGIIGLEHVDIEH